MNNENGEASTAAAGAAGEQLNIKVKAQDGTEIFFKIKKSTQLKKLMDAYCQRQGLSNNQCRFIFDGERIKEDDTPDTLEMENGDEIDVMVEQTGGSKWESFDINTCNQLIMSLFSDASGRQTPIQEPLQDSLLTSSQGPYSSHLY